MAIRKIKIGTVACPLCGVECVVKAEGGDSKKTLNYVCHSGCDSPSYAPKDTEAHQIILSRMKPIAQPKAAAPAPDKPAALEKPAAAPTAPAAQPVKKKAGFFA